MARMALEAKVPVIPLAVIGTNIVAPPGKIYGSYTRPHVRFGKPLDFSRYEGMEGDRYVLRSITDEIMYEIMQLSGQEYVDVYAAKAKEDAQREAKAAAAAAKAEAKVAKSAKEDAHAQSQLAVAQEQQRAAEADDDPPSVDVDGSR
jgi:1-acyl-sn-glycerol-3-phosphate acyltransferase